MPHVIDVMKYKSPTNGQYMYVCVHVYMYIIMCIHLIPIFGAIALLYYSLDTDCGIAVEGLV